MIATRAEQPGDAVAVSEVHTAAFGRPDEASLVVGHVVFAPVTLHCYQAPFTVLALSPMAVLPAWQRRGIGSAPVREGLAACRASGHDVVVVVGHPAFYPRFGFTPARPAGLMSEPAFPDEAFMVAELTPGALRGRRGVVLFSGDYGESR